jgi:gamma-glutamyltranspeptidase/glutathione hydrolase
MRKRVTAGTLVSMMAATLPVWLTAHAGGAAPASRAPYSSAPPAAPAALAAAQPVTARHAMVVTAQHLATEVGVRILKEGGNAVDAAVAVGYALAVVHPCCGNIGGGGFMMIHLASGKNVFLDFREKAPLKATPRMYQDSRGKVVPGLSTKTFLGVGVPGTVMGLNAALKRYGTLPLSRVIEPAIQLARDGYVLDRQDVNIFDRRAQDFAKHPNVAAIFLNHGKPYVVGERLRQPQLAGTLERISHGGTAAFYHGSIARAVVAASKAHGGLLSMKDFADYSVAWGEPVTCQYHGYTLVSDPPPSSGGTTMCEILQILAPYPLAKWGYGSAEVLHYLAEAERRAFADRNSDLGDPAFVHNPIEELISPQHAATLRASIRADEATPSAQLSGNLAALEGTDTTDYSVVDARGNAVAVTYTINFYFGSGYIAGDTGFFLNDEMDDFTSKPGVPNAFGLVQGKANQIEPGKRPLSSMSPTIVLRGKRLFMVTGSPGGSTIISTTLESFLNVAEFGMNMQQAVNAPRVHQQWYPDEVFVEPGLLSPTVQRRLEKMGYRFKEVPSLGADEAILVDPRTHLLEGANDRRRPGGLAAGY